MIVTFFSGVLQKIKGGWIIPGIFSPIVHIVRQKVQLTGTNRSRGLAIFSTDKLERFNVNILKIFTATDYKFRIYWTRNSLKPSKVQDLTLLIWQQWQRGHTRSHLEHTRLYVLVSYLASMVDIKLVIWESRTLAD